VETTAAAAAAEVVVEIDVIRGQRYFEKEHQLD